MAKQYAVVTLPAGIYAVAIAALKLIVNSAIPKVSGAFVIKGRQYNGVG